MSFDLRISQGDLVIGTDGDLQKVEETDKLAQDVLKLLVTPVGANQFFPWYGSLLAASAIGSVIDFVFLNSVIENQINNSLQVLQRMQKDQQASDQPVTAAELLAAIKSIKVERNTVDPTQFTVNVEILSRALKQTTISFDIL